MIQEPQVSGQVEGQMVRVNTVFPVHKIYGDSQSSSSSVVPGNVVSWLLWHQIVSRSQATELVDHQFPSGADQGKSHWSEELGKEFGGVVSFFFFSF